MRPEEQEFYSSLAILGGIVFAGLILIISLTLVALAVYNRVTRDKVTKDLYNERERKNGQEKAGARKHW